MKKQPKTYLICFNFKFYGSVPNIYEVNEQGELISNIHKEVSSKKTDGSRWFKASIQKPGRYKFSNLNMDKENQIFHLFQGKINGFFTINEKKELFLIN